MDIPNITIITLFIYICSMNTTDIYTYITDFCHKHLLSCTLKDDSLSFYLTEPKNRSVEVTLKLWDETNSIERAIKPSDNMSKNYKEILHQMKNLLDKGRSMTKREFRIWVEEKIKNKKS